MLHYVWYSVKKRKIANLVTVGISIMLLVIIGAVIGSAAGVMISGNISVVNAGESYYETTYTVGLTNADNKIAVEEAEDSVSPALWSTLFIAAAGVGIAWVKMDRSLRREPMQLLAERQEE